MKWLSFYSCRSSIYILKLDKDMSCYTLFSYRIFGRVLNIIKSFLPGRSLKVVVNGQVSEAYEINAGIPQVSLLGPILGLLYINDLPKNILRLLVISMQMILQCLGCTSKNQV